MGRALLTDYYEINMAASYLRRHMTAPATFSLFVRQLPPTRRFLVAAGLQECLAFLEDFRFEDDDLEYVRDIGCDEETVQALRGVRFTGSVRAVPEGRIVFADEPLLEVTAPVAEAQLVETFLLNQLTFQTTLASKAARCRLAAAGRMDLVEFGFRRTHGIEAGVLAARAAALAGFRGTSNVEASRRYGLTPSGTMAHSYVESFPSQLEAFRTFAADLPGRAIFLVDTYDTAGGVRDAATVVLESGLAERAGIRIDSGDLVEESRRARAQLDEAGLPHVRIFVSGGLDEHDVARFVEQGAPIDAVGIGTRLGVSADAPMLDSAYKLVAYDGQPVMKLSTGKVSLPGAKQVFRSADLRDTIGLADERPPEGTEGLLQPVMAHGARLFPAPSPAVALSEARWRFEADLDQLPGDLRSLEPGPGPAPAHSDALRALTDEVAARLRKEEGRHEAGER